jgi:hypothetical protein
MRGAAAHKRGARGALIGAAGLLAVLQAPAASACAIAMPTCVSEVNGRLSSAHINPPGVDNAVLFHEFDAKEQNPETLYLVECRSRRAVKMKLPAAGSEAVWKAEDYLTQVMISDEQVTLQDIRAELKGLGLQASLTTLPAGHCGCDLATMETIGCGDFGP